MVTVFCFGLSLSLYNICEVSPVILAHWNLSILIKTINNKLYLGGQPSARNININININIILSTVLSRMLNNEN